MVGRNSSILCLTQSLFCRVAQAGSDLTCASLVLGWQALATVPGSEKKQGFLLLYPFGSLHNSTALISEEQTGSSTHFWSSPWWSSFFSKAIRLSSLDSSRQELWESEGVIAGFPCWFLFPQRSLSLFYQLSGVSSYCLTHFV